MEIAPCVFDFFRKRVRFGRAAQRRAARGAPARAHARTRLRTSARRRAVLAPACRLYTRLHTAVIAANATAWLPSLGRALQLRE